MCHYSTWFYERFYYQGLGNCYRPCAPLEGSAEAAASANEDWGVNISLGTQSPEVFTGMCTTLFLDLINSWLVVIKKG